MIRIGQIHTLVVLKKVAFGFYLDGENLGEILLPNNLAPSTSRVGDFIEVFLYSDSEDRIIATTNKPKLVAGQFAYLNCVDVNAYGAFFDWGLSKDLCVPKKEQAGQIEVNKRYIVHAFVNHGDDRVVGSTKYEKYLDDHTPHRYKAGDKVKVLISRKSDLGYKVIVDDAHWGILYFDNVFTNIYYGEVKQGYIQRVRDDGKLDVTLQLKKHAIVDDQQTILAYLKKNNGASPLNDKSSPEDIKQALNMSKNAFKRALGKLLASKTVVKQGDTISLN